jgi:hypothetical protein
VRPANLLMILPSREMKASEIIARLLRAGWTLAQIRAKFPELFDGPSP